MAGVKSMNRYTSVDSVDGIYIKNSPNGTIEAQVKWVVLIIDVRGVKVCSILDISLSILC